MLIPVAEVANDYASELEKKLRKDGIRVKSDLSNDRMNAKIRKAQQLKIPYMLILGEKEMNAKTVSVRYRNGKQAYGLSYDDFLSEIKAKVESKEQL